ncbi:unnamed protein product, partial [Urochloa humidicola]
IPIPRPLGDEPYPAAHRERRTHHHSGHPPIAPLVNAGSAAHTTTPAIRSTRHRQEHRTHHHSGHPLVALLVNAGSAAHTLSPQQRWIESGGEQPTQSILIADGNQEAQR